MLAHFTIHCDTKIEVQGPDIVVIDYYTWRFTGKEKGNRKDQEI